MKKILIFIACLAIFAGCKKTSYVANFDKAPQERAADQISLVSTTLTTAQNGWVATLPTQQGGGYAFYLKFDNSNNVTMFADLTDESATTVGKSYYRVKQDIGTDLVFDSYCYLAMLNDPKAAVLGGQDKIGYKSDVDFIFDRIAGDSIVFIGKKYRQPFKLVKATAAQKTAYEAGALKTSMDKMKTFFSNINNPYIEVGTGATMVKTAIALNYTNVLAIGKRLTLTGVLADNKTVVSAGAKFSFSLTGADLLGNGLVYSGITFVRIAWKDAATLAFYDNTGKEYIIKSNATPLTPLSLLFGFPTSFPYKKMSIGANLPLGVNSGFNAVYNQMKALFVGSGRSVTSITFTLASNSLFQVDINYLSGTSAFVATASYPYTKVDDVITLGNNPSYTANWTTRAIQIKPLADYMFTGPFKIDWVVSSDPNVTSLGGLYRTADLGSFIYGTL